MTDSGAFNGGSPLTSEWVYTTASIEGNVPPVADPGGPYLVDEDVTLVFDGSGSHDPNNTPIAYAWDFDGDGAPDATAQSPSNGWAISGLYTVTLSVSDGLLGSTGTTTVTVAPSNAPPSFVKGSNVVVGGGVYPRTAAGWATDILPGPPDEAGQAVNFVISGNDRPDLFDTGPAVSPAGDLSFIPSYAADDTASVTLHLADDAGGVSPDEMFTITVLGDADEDGIWDAWEYAHFGTSTTAHATSDYDLDLFLDVDEYRADTDPDDPLSLLQVLKPQGSAVGTNGVGLVVRWQSVTSRHYNVQRATHLVQPAPFVDVHTNVPGEAPDTTVTDTNAVGPGPYQYRVTVEEW